MRNIANFLEFDDTPQVLREYHPACLMQLAFVSAYELKPDSDAEHFNASREFYNVLRKHPLSGSSKTLDITKDDFPFRPLWSGLHEYTFKTEDRVVGCPVEFKSELYQLRGELNKTILNPSTRTTQLSAKMYAVSRAYQEEWTNILKMVRLGIERESRAKWDAAPDSLKRIIKAMRNPLLN